jgi:hypothetical protein
MSSSPDSDELRRDPPPPYGVSAPPHRALPPDRGVSSSSSPIAAIAIELCPSRSRPCSWSTPASFTGAPALALRCLRCLPRHRIGWMVAATPTSLPCCAWPLGREHDVAPSSVQPLDGGLAATTVAAPSCRHNGLRSCSLVSTPVSSTPPCFCVLAMVAWPASQACLPMLLLCHAVAIVLLKLVLLLLLLCSSSTC